MSLSLLCHHLSHNSGERDGTMERRNIAYSYIYSPLRVYIH